MYEHLTDEEMNEALGRANPAEVREHLEVCTACRAEQDTIGKALAGMRDWARLEVDRPDDFWEMKRRAVQAALKTPQVPRRRLSWTWAAATAFILLFAVIRIERPSRPDAQLATDPDHQLLLEVQRNVRREVPEALEPAALLIHEIGRASSAAQTQGERQ